MVTPTIPKHAFCAAAAAFLLGCGREPDQVAGETDSDTAGDVETDGPQRRPAFPPNRDPASGGNGGASGSSTSSMGDDSTTGGPLPPATDTLPEATTETDDGTGEPWAAHTAECSVPGELEPGWPGSCHMRAPLPWLSDYHCCRNDDDCPLARIGERGWCDGGVCSGCEP